MAINKRFAHLNHSGSNHSILDAESAYITGTLQVGPAIPALGSDVNFFVSGNKDGEGGATPGVGVFGGDLVVSGNLHFLGGITGSIPGAEVYWASEAANEIFTSASLVNVPSGSVNAQFLSSSTGAEISGSAIFAGSGGINVGSDTVFFVSGANGSVGKAVFGGDLHVSGNIEIEHGIAIQSTLSGSSGLAEVFYVAELPNAPDTIGIGDYNGLTDGVVFFTKGNAGPVAIITGSNAGYFSGSYTFPQGITGSITKVPDGTDYLLAGTGIQLTTQSNGAITIDATGGVDPVYWFSTGSNEIYTTGSVLIRGGISNSRNLIEFDVSGSGFIDNFGNAMDGGSAIKVKDVDVADPTYSSISGALFLMAANVLASGSGGAVNIYAGNGGYISSSLQLHEGGYVNINAGNGGINPDADPTAAAGGGGAVSVYGGIGGEGYSRPGDGGGIGFGAGSGGTISALNTTDPANGGNGGNIDFSAGAGGPSQFGGTKGIGGTINFIGGHGGEGDGELGQAGDIIFRGGGMTTADFVASASLVASRLTFGISEGPKHAPFRIVSFNHDAENYVEANYPDVFFYVSGATGYNAFNKALFGGNVKTSGSFIGQFGTASLQSTLPNNDVADIVQYRDLSSFTYGARSIIFGDFSRTDGYIFAQSGNLGSPVIAIITGSNQGYFSGSYTFPQGLSGSLTKLANGSSYIIAGTGINVSSASNGAITIDATGGVDPVYFYSLTNDIVETSGSLYVTGALRAEFLSSSTGAEITGSVVVDLTQGPNKTFVLSGSYGNTILPYLEIVDATLLFPTYSLFTVGGVSSPDKGVAVFSDDPNVYIKINPFDTGFADINAVSGTQGIALYSNYGLQQPALELRVSSSYATGSIIVQDESLIPGSGDLNLVIRGFAFNGDSGAAGYVLTSSGPGVSPGWAPIPGLESQPELYYIAGSDPNGTAATSGSLVVSGAFVVTGAAQFSPAGTGRGLLKFGGLDIGPITGSMPVTAIEQTGAVLSGNLLSASNGIGIESVLRHEFHILGSGFDGSGNPNIFAATYLVMSFVKATGVQEAIAVTELSRETSGSYASSWDVNVNSNCDIEVTGSVGGNIVRWYGQRVKEMSLGSAGAVT